jgi:hypothetical protein
MITKIRVEGRIGKEWLALGKEYKKLSDNGKLKVAQKLEDLLVQNIYAHNLVWRSNLVDSVGVNLIENDQLAVELKFYAWAIQQGHYIPPSSRLIPILKTWALDKMPERQAYAWLTNVFIEGHRVLARPFISDSMTSLKPQIINIMKKEMRRSG